MRLVIAVVAFVAVVAASCSADQEARPIPEQRPADKATCSEALLGSDILPPLDRTLVPYGPQLLGVETTYGDADRRVRIISGGYLDDVFEAYDDMVEIDSAIVRDTEAIVLESELLGDPVFAAVWREDTEAPCDAHAIITTGLSEAVFEELLASIQ